jgi:N-formylglutamate deformylase
MKVGHAIPGVLLRFDPTVPAVPIVVDVSRSGREYPATFRSPAAFSDVHGAASMYVEELWSPAPDVGAQMLYALFPNTFIDANRSRDDIDPELIEGEWPRPLEKSGFTERGLGLLKRKTPRGEPLHEGPLPVAEVEDRLRRYYDPYHAELAAMLAQARARFGHVLHLSCHCMNPTGASNHPDAGKPRPDFCVGNLGGQSSSEAALRSVRDAFAAEGYEVTMNWPYEGGELNRRHGDPMGGIQSVMVEMNKRLFMDVASGRKSAGFESTRAAIGKVLRKLAAS